MDQTTVLPSADSPMAVAEDREPESHAGHRSRARVFGVQAAEPKWFMVIRVIERHVGKGRQLEKAAESIQGRINHIGQFNPGSAERLRADFQTVKEARA